ncbi:MAG: ABC transporter permease [Acidimicrobiia bacterium]|nr:ABC transporter permease [Acidimicrobiia bacterium]
MALEKIVVGAIQALIGGLLVFPAVLFIHAAGQAPVIEVASWPLLILVMVSGSILASAGALFLGTVTDPDKIQVLFALVLLPMTMLGGVYYPWAALSNIPWLQVLVLANPMVYVSEGLRATLTAQLPHMPTPAFLLVLLIGAVGLSFLGSTRWSVGRGEFRELIR